MNVQDLSRFEASDGVPRNGLVSGYMSGFGNSFETEALAGRAAGRKELTAEGRLRPLCRAAFGFAIHRAAVHQPALLALSHPADGQAFRALP